MDEKHAFLVATIMFLCVAEAATILWYLGAQAETDFIKQHLGIEEVHLGEGVQFSNSSWVFKNAQPKNLTCAIPQNKTPEKCPDFYMMYLPEFPYVVGNGTLTIFMDPKQDWIQTDEFKLPEGSEWKLVNWTTTHPTWDVGFCKTTDGNATYACHKQYVTVLDGSPTAVYLRARSESLKAMSPYEATMQFRCGEKEKNYTIRVKVGVG